jgi:phosphate transport system substrate-binding protein
MTQRIQPARKEASLLRIAMKAAVLMAAVATSQPATAQGSITQRDRMQIVSSASSVAVTEALVSRFTDHFEGVRRPQVRITGTGRGFEAFCVGIGPETPDILVATRRMPRSTFENCQANGVAEIIEIRLGLGAVVLAARRGDPATPLTSNQVYEALAAEHAQNETFVTNRAVAWADVDPALPRRDIRVIVPEAGSGTRALFEDLVMEAGCREVRPIRLLFEAAYRRGKCITLRNDGRVVAVRSDDVVSALMAAPTGTLAVMSFDQVVRSAGNVVPVSLDGVLPNAASIAALEYDQTRSVYLYAKRQHSRNRQGIGVVRGVREMLVEATTEQASGPGGYLSAAGLVPLAPAERAEQRRIAERSSLMSR